MLRTLILLLCLFPCVSNAEAKIAVVQPGLHLGEFSSICASHGVTVTDQVLLSVIPSDKETELAAAKLDDGIVAIIAYDKSSSVVKSIGVYFIPDTRTNKTQVVYREASEIVFHDDETFSLRLKKVSDASLKGADK